MNVRPATFGDVAQIAAVHVAGWQVGYRGLLPQSFLDGLTTAERLSRWSATVHGAARPGLGTFVADDAGDVVGFVNIGPTRDGDLDSAQVGEVKSLYVLPGVWGQGIGRSLADRGDGQPRRGLPRKGNVVGAGQQLSSDFLLPHNGLGSRRRGQTRHGWGPDHPGPTFR